MFKVAFKNRNIIVEVGQGCSVLEAAMQNGIQIYHTCGGNASCSTCRVRILSGAENISGIESAEAQVLDAFDLKSPHRLGCQALVLRGDVEVEIPDHEREPRPNKTPEIPENKPKTKGTRF